MLAAVYHGPHDIRVEELPKPTIDPASIRPRIDELVALLGRRSLRARHLHREIAPVLEGMAEAEQLLRLEEEIGRLDYDAARQRLLHLFSADQAR